MNYSATAKTTTHQHQFVPSRRMGIIYYEPQPIHQVVDMWANDLLVDDTSPSMFSEQVVNQAKPYNDLSCDASHATAGPDHRDKCYDHQESSKPNDQKVLRRLAQNREAARKSRLRKKAYVQQLEKSRLRLVQLEQELDRAKQQGLYAGNKSLLGCSGASNQGIATFEMEYAHWVEAQDRQTSELRNALCNLDSADAELIRVSVNKAVNHYFKLFAMKAEAAKADVFYLISGMWKTPTERIFLWIGGFRPSELLKILLPNLDATLSEKQHLDVDNLIQSCQQAEEALSQGLDRLHYAIADDLICGEGSYLPRLGSAMEKFEALVRFVAQADHVRQVTLQQMSQILTTRQTGEGLLALGEYMKRLRALSSCWSSRPHEPAS